MDKKIYSKILAVMLIVTLTFANFIFLAVTAGRSYAASLNYEEQETSVEKTDVSFDAFFVSESGVQTHTLTTEMNKDELKLFLSVAATSGYLKNAVVSIENSNFKLVKGEKLPDGVEGIDVENNTLVLNQISKGETKLLEIPIEVIKDETFDLNNFSKDANVKLTGTFVNNAAKEIAVDKSIVVNLSLSEDADTNLLGEVSKYVVFEEEGIKKALLQIAITSNVIDNLLPVKSTEIKMEVPKLDEQEPEYVSLVSTSTRATNGNDGTVFGEENYTYEDGVISLSVLNEANENNYVSWVKNSTDKYLLNLVYVLAENTEEVEEANKKIQLNLTSKLSLYNNEEKEIEKEFIQEVELMETNQVVSFEFNNEVNEIAKGYMLVKDAANTEYKQNIEMNIGYSPIVDEIELNKGAEYYTDENGTVHTATTYYRTITVNKENLIKILGEDGYVEIIDQEGLGIATLNKEAVSMTFAEGDTAGLTIRTSKPIAEGTLKIETIKYIKPVEYDVNTIKTLNTMTSTLIGKTNLSEEVKTAETTLANPTLQVSSGISSNALSTVIENENVEIRVALQTNNNTNRLFKNPIIEVELPSYIKDVEVNSMNLLYNAELMPKSAEIKTNEAGNKVIVATLEGEQTKFNDVSSVEGTTLIIGTNLTVDQATPSTTQTMNVVVINNNEEIITTNTDINYAAPAGVITLNSISGYNDKQEVLTSISGEEEIGVIPVAGPSRIATQTITVINNYDYTCGNIEILGRTPSEGNKRIASTRELGSTFTAKMISELRPVSGVNAEDIVIYYSENENATQDWADETNGWTTTPESLENIKSYLIVVEGNMVKGDVISFNYDIEIPEGLSREENTYSMFKVYYTNMDGAIKGAKETATSQVVGLSTGIGAELDVKLTANVENGAEVAEGDYIEYTISITNTGKETAKNVIASADIPRGTYYVYKEYHYDIVDEIYVRDTDVKTYTKTFETIEPGETVTTKFEIEVGTRTEVTMSKEEYEALQDLITSTLTWEEYVEITDKTKVDMIATAKVMEDNGEEVVFTSNNILNPKIKGKFRMILRSDINQTQKLPGNLLMYTLELERVNGDVNNNLEIKCEIPDGLTYHSSSYNQERVKEEINGSTITWKIEKLENNEDFVLNCTIDDFKDVKEKEITVKMVATCDEYEEQVESNAISFKVGKPALEITHSTNNKIGTLTEGDIIEYNLTVKNTTNVPATNVKLTDYISDGLLIEEITYSKDNSEVISSKTSEKVNEIVIDLEGNQTLTVKVKAKANYLEEDETSKKVSHYFEVEADLVEKITSDKIEHTVELIKYDPSEDDEDVTVGNSISGVAWLDENKNGIREENEKLLPEIQVILINENGDTIASDMTRENGLYAFNDLAQGNYIVVFMYDQGNYDITSYEPAPEYATVNCDAVDMEININGITTDCAATNVINLTSSQYNIDLGLVLSPKFDLSLTKTISKITVQTAKGTKVKECNNSTLEKVEISSKELNGATVAIEYTIMVTNNGAIAGYANRIVDYLSSTDLKFNSELNTDWFLGTDGNLYNTTLANTILQPGQSAVLKLVLTKNMTENNTGLTNNTAEIYEAYNDEGIKDYNSTSGNKAQSENDLGKADIIIGPKTGVALYIGSVIIFMSILAVGIYVLNKKVIKKI